MLCEISNELYVWLHIKHEKEIFVIITTNDLVEPNV